MPRISISIGVAPENAGRYNDDIESTIRTLASNKNVRAIGSCGLSQPGSDEEVYAFRRQIALANEMDLPLIVAAHKVFDEAFDILDSEATLPTKVLIRSFDGSEEQLMRWVGIGAYVSFGAKAADDPLHFANLARLVPSDRIMVESGAPNESIEALSGYPPRADQVVFVADALMGVCPAVQIAHNMRTFFGL